MRNLLARMLLGTGLLLMALGVSNPARAATFDVACNTADLIAAVNTANGNGEADTINLASGCTYSFMAGDATHPDSALPRITSAITINGNGATLARDAGAATHFRLIYVAISGSLTLNGVTVTGGSRAGASGLDGSGGGIYNDGGLLTIVNSTITGNHASSDGVGGGIANQAGTTVITDSAISSNTAGFGGGGFNSSGGFVTVNGGTISGNDADSGGAVRTFSTVVKLIGTSVTGNSGDYGGAFNNFGNLTLIGTSITGNSASNLGGAILESGTLNIVSSTIAGNSATGHGGGIYKELSNPMTVTNTIISGNSSGADGGGIYVTQGTGSLPANISILSSTLAGNSAAGNGGSIYHEESSLSIANSILWGNSSGLYIASFNTLSIVYTDTEGGVPSGDGNLSTDPQFVAPVAHTSAPTSAGDYHLSAGSVAIDRGRDSDLPADTFDIDGDLNTAEALPLDFEGDERVIDVTVSTYEVDMGADEYHPCVEYASPYTVPAGDSADLAFAITCANRKPDANVINLTMSTYNFTVGDTTNSDSALPQITTPITIDGNGATLQRDSGAATNFRLLYVQSSGTLTLHDAVVSGGISGGSGGGLYNEGGVLTVSDSTISGNSASNGGGISSSSSSTLTLIGTTLTGNSANPSIGSGGGVNTNNSTVTITDSTFSSNSAAAGGGLYTSGGTLTVVDSMFTTNTVSAGSSGLGGAINTVGGTNKVIRGTTITGNSAKSGGGIVTGGTMTIINSTIAGNTAINDGGGIYGGSTLNIINTLITGNTAGGNGGGVIQDAGSVTVSSSTISGNSAAGGGGLYFVTVTATVTNSIVWGNSSQIGGAAVATVTYSTVDGGVSGTGNLSGDPLFVFAPPYAAAPTTTGDFHLQYGSPALNSGSAASLPADTLDLDGDSNTAEALPIDFGGSDRVMGPGVDMGVYELEQYVLLANTSFETDANADKVPDGWTLVNKTGDKLLCDPLKAHSGNCAFKFKGGVPENAKLSQSADLTGLSFGAGDTLALSAWFKGVSTSAKSKFILSVTYTGNPIPVKTKLTVKQHTAYTQRALPDYILTAGTVDQIKVTFQHKSAAGTVYVDDASLIYTPGGGPRGTRSEILPPPLAPSGFRGGN